MKKKLLAMLLAAVMVMAMLPTAFAADTSGKCGDNLTWTYSNSTLTIQGTGPMKNYGWDDLRERPWSAYIEEIRTIIIDNGVTTIGELAFMDCHSLTSVTIPGSVASIGENAFEYCNSLASVTIPDGVISIGDGAFYECGSLFSVTIPDSVTTIGAAAFAFCHSLTSVTIPGNVTIVGEIAFDYCGSLKDIYYGGSESQWKQIFSDNGYDIPFTHVTVHYNSTTTPTEPTTPTVAFTDVNEGDWYYKEVLWAVENNITNGITYTTFVPTRNCTHEQILTFLYRANRGGDVAASADDMAEAVSWALKEGMIDDSFVPDADCTRADAVKYIYAVLGEETSADISFEDVDADADYAAAVAWAVDAGVTNGYPGNIFQPDKTCDRGIIVTFLYRAYVEPLSK